MKPKFVLQWHITHKCNLRCKHCYQEEYDKDLELSRLTDIFKQFNMFLKKNGYFGHINFTGGEPFVSENLWALMDMCEENKNTFGILTNATLLNKEIVERLRTYQGLRFVQISLDGDKSIHDSIRGAGSFDNAMDGIQLLKKAGIQTMVSFTCSRENKDALKKVIRICEKAGVDRFWTDRLVPMGRNELACMSTEEYRQYLDILGKEARRARLLPWIKTTIHTNRAMQFICNCKDGGYRCSAGERLLTILADGTLLPCRRLPLTLGNLTTEKLCDIMKNSEIVKELRTAGLPDECGECACRNKCNGGAKCLTYAVTGQWNKKDINCWNTKS